MVIFLADQTMSAQSLCRAQADLADYKHPIPLLTDKAQEMILKMLSPSPQKASITIYTTVKGSHCRAVGHCRALSATVGLFGHCRAVGLSGCRVSLDMPDTT